VSDRIYSNRTHTINLPPPKNEINKYAVVTNQGHLHQGVPSRAHKTNISSRTDLLLLLFLSHFILVKSLSLKYRFWLLYLLHIISKFHYVTVGLQTFHIQCVGMCMIYLHTKLHLSSSSGSLVITINLQTTENFHMAATKLLYLHTHAHTHTHTNYLNKSCIFILDLLWYITSGPDILCRLHLTNSWVCLVIDD
jgi:hypothetical protein